MDGETTAADPEELMRRTRWESAARRDAFRWRHLPDECHVCGERIGHWGGSVDRDSCSLIPLDVPLDELRPNCYAVRRLRIVDAIRAACDRRDA